MRVSIFEKSLNDIVSINIWQLCLEIQLLQEGVREKRLNTSYTSVEKLNKKKKIFHLGKIEKNHVEPTKIFYLFVKVFLTVYGWGLEDLFTILNEKLTYLDHYHMHI